MWMFYGKLINDGLYNVHSSSALPGQEFDSRSSCIALSNRPYVSRSTKALIVLSHSALVRPTPNVLTKFKHVYMSGKTRVYMLRFSVGKLIPPASILSRRAAQLACSDGWVDHIELVCGRPTHHTVVGLQTWLSLEQREPTS